MTSPFTPPAKSQAFVHSIRTAAITPEDGRAPLLRVLAECNALTLSDQAFRRLGEGYILPTTPGTARRELNFASARVTQRRVHFLEIVDPDVSNDLSFLTGNKRPNLVFVDSLSTLPIQKVDALHGETADEYNTRLRTGSMLFLQNYPIPKTLDAVSLLHADIGEPLLMLMSVSIWDAHVKNGVPFELFDSENFCVEAQYLLEQAQIDRLVLVQCAAAVAHGKFNAIPLKVSLNALKRQDGSMFRRYEAALKVLLQHNNGATESRSNRPVLIAEVMDVIPSRQLFRQRKKVKTSIFSVETLLANASFLEGTLNQAEKGPVGGAIAWESRAFFENYKTLVLISPGGYLQTHAFRGVQCPVPKAYVTGDELEFMNHPFVFMNNPLKDLYNPIQLE